jgi:hypothetical protein
VDGNVVRRILRLLILRLELLIALLDASMEGQVGQVGVRGGITRWIGQTLCCCSRLAFFEVAPEDSHLLAQCGKHVLVLSQAVYTQVRWVIQSKIKVKCASRLTL